MVVTGAVALVVTSVAGLATEMLGHREAIAEQRNRSRDQEVRGELVALGFRPPASSALRELSMRLAASHGVEILHADVEVELTLDNGVVTAGPAEERALAAATVLVVDELTRLPAELLKKSGLARVMLVTDLAEERRAIPSLPNYNRSLMLDVDASPAFMRRLLHHEVFHFIDLADDGEVLRDPAWERLNPPGFRYGAGGRAMREPSASALSREFPGFATRYAMSAIEEDKAELFAFLVTEPAALRDMAREDAHLAAKIAALQACLARLVPGLDIGRSR